MEYGTSLDRLLVRIAVNDQFFEIVFIFDFEELLFQNVLCLVHNDIKYYLINIIDRIYGQVSISVDSGKNDIVLGIFR